MRRFTPRKTKPVSQDQLLICDALQPVVPDHLLQRAADAVLKVLNDPSNKSSNYSVTGCLRIYDSMSQSEALTSGEYTQECYLIGMYLELYHVAFDISFTGAHNFMVRDLLTYLSLMEDFDQACRGLKLFFSSQFNWLTSKSPAFLSKSQNLKKHIQPNLSKSSLKKRLRLRPAARTTIRSL